MSNYQMIPIYLVVGLVVIIIKGFFWIWATNTILENKGYKENWSIFAFFFGFIAFVFACTEPDVVIEQKKPALTRTIRKARYAKLVPSGFWSCKCGKRYSSNTPSCSCGIYKYEAKRENSETRRNEARVAQEYAEFLRQSKLIRLLEKAEHDNIQRVKEYKSLLDTGAMTIDEFEKRKRVLLDL